MAVRFPPKAEAVASEPTGVVADAQIQVARVAFEVVQAVRMDHAACGTGKIVVESLLGFLGVQPAVPEQKPQEFLVFGIHAHDRIAREHKGIAMLGDKLKLPIAIDVALER